MLLKTPSANARPFHVTVQISDIMAVMKGISGNIFQWGILSTLQVIFPETHTKEYVVHVFDNYCGDVRAIAHTRYAGIDPKSILLEFLTILTAPQVLRNVKIILSLVLRLHQISVRRPKMIQSKNGYTRA